MSLRVGFEDSKAQARLRLSLVCLSLLLPVDEDLGLTYLSSSTPAMHAATLPTMLVWVKSLKL